MKQEFYKMAYEDWDEGVELFGTGEPALALEGAYLRLCHKMYRVRGPVSSNLNLLAKLWGVHYNTAKSYLQKLIDYGKVSLESGGAHILNTRVSQELHSRGMVSAVRAQSGRSGGAVSGQSRGSAAAEDEKQMTFQGMSEPIASSDTKQNPQRREEKRREEKKDSDAGASDWPVDAFEQFYARYPHKVGKEGTYGARNAFKKMQRIPGAKFVDVMAGLERYIAGKPVERPWLNPATFLNQGRWQDQPAGLGAPTPAADSKPTYLMPTHGERVTQATCPVEYPTLQKHVGRVYVRNDSDEWHAWLFYLCQDARKRGAMLPIITPIFNQGWTFPERWPPDHPNATPAQG